MSLYPTIRLADAAEIAAGVTLGRKAKEKDLVEVPYLRVANVQDGHLLLDDLKVIAATRSEVSKLTLKNGDLLLTEGGDLDKLGRGALWREQVPLCIHQNHIFRVRLNRGLYDPDYVSFQIGSPYGKAYFLAHAKKTTGIASINQQVLGAFPLISPPIEAQRNVAADLIARLAVVDAAQAAAKAQANDIAILRRRVLEETFAACTTAPRKRLGEHAQTTSGSTPPRGVKAYWTPADVPWVKTGEVTFSPIWKTEEAISAKALKECSLTLLPPETVLVAMYGQGKTRGQSAVLKVPAATNQACFAILPNETWDPDFLFYWLMASYHDLRGLSEGRGGSQANLNGGLLNALEIPAPSREQQAAIARHAEDVLHEVGVLAAANSAQQGELARLPQRLLAQAFLN